MALKFEDENKKVVYVNVLQSEGVFVMNVPEGTVGAGKRDWFSKDYKEDKDGNVLSGKKGTKWERKIMELSGVIADVSFYDGDFGKNLILTIVDGDELPVVLSLPSASNYGEDTMKKLPALDLFLPVVMRPYSFTDDAGRIKRGMTIWQSGNKVNNFFYDTAKKEVANGYPEVIHKIDPKTKEKKPWSTEEWKHYFSGARLFLIEYIEQNIVSKFADKKTVVQVDDEQAAAPSAGPDDYNNF